MKKLGKIDKFFVVWLLIFITLGGLTLFTFRTIFVSFVTAYEIERDTGPKIEIKKDDLQEAHNFVFERKEPQLNVSQ